MHNNAEVDYWQMIVDFIMKIIAFFKELTGEDILPENNGDNIF